MRVIPSTPAPFHPVLCTPRIRVPVLKMVAPEDEMNHANPLVARAGYEGLAGEKVWYEIDGGHFGLLWYPPDLFEEAARVQAEFLKNYLSDRA